MYVCVCGYCCEVYIVKFVHKQSCVSLTATWVGGGFILGIAEATYNPTLGAVWALMPVPYVLTFFLGKCLKSSLHRSLCPPLSTRNIVTGHDHLRFKVPLFDTSRELIFICQDRTLV